MEKRDFHQQPPTAPGPYPPPSYENSTQQGYTPYANVGAYPNYPPPPGGVYENVHLGSQPHGHLPGVLPQVVYVQTPSFTEFPVETTCPSCSSRIRTTVESEAGPGAYITALVIASFGFICGCCLIPFGIDTMRIYQHRCPSCNYLLARHAGSSSCGSNAVYTPNETRRH